MKSKKVRLREVVQKLDGIECEHDFSEFHMYEVVCKHCRICRGYTAEDLKNLEKKKLYTRSAQQKDKS